MVQNLLASPQENSKLDLIADLHTLEGMLTSFLQAIKPDAWQQRERRTQTDEWTLYETVAHLAAAAEFYLSALQHTLRNEVLVIQGFQQRRDLPAYNQQEIMLRQNLSPLQLITALQEALCNTIALAEQITPAQLQWQVQVPVFNRPLTVLEVLETQATHPGLVHAVQITVPAGVDPLWSLFKEDFMHRMLTRFFHLMTLTYWPERGGNLRATLQFIVAGAAGGAWYVRIAPTGCQSGEERSPDPRVTIQATSADALCQLFTGKITIMQALFRKKISVRGNLLLATRLLSLFSPT
jgi:hypothetical protein